MTGRTHQIRAHLAHIGCPILGDSKYGNNAANRELRFKYQALCAWELRFLRKSATRGLRISPGGYSTPRSRGITSRFWTVR